MFRDSWLCQVAPPAPSYCAYTLVRTCACTLIGSHWARFYAPSRWVPKIGAPFTIGFPWFPSNQTWRLEIPSFLSWFDERKINRVHLQWRPSAAQRYPSSPTAGTKSLANRTWRIKGSGCVRFVADMYFLTNLITIPQYGYRFYCFITNNPNPCIVLRGS